MLPILKKIYRSLPYNRLLFLRSIPDRVLFGRSYQETHPSFDESMFAENLVKTISYARIHTAYGKQNLPINVTISNVFDVIANLPLISSSDLSENLDHFTSDEFSNRNSYLTTTGGTGRNPTSIRLANTSYGAEWAHMHAIWKTTGYQRNKVPKLTLRGVSVAGKKIWEFNPIYNEITVDSFRLSSENFPALFHDLKQFPSLYLHGYPSLVKEFHDYCQECGLHRDFRGVFLGSEGSLLSDRKKIAEFFSCPVITWYGQSEKVVLAADTEMTGRFRIFSSYGYPYIHEPDETGFGEIIGTGFLNPALPLVNYRTGDYARIENTPNGPVMTDITGRWGKDFIFLHSQKRIPATSINLHSEIQHEILFYQIVQKEFGILEIIILPKRTTRMDEATIIRAFEKDLSGKLRNFKVSYKVTHDEREIIRSPRGKMIMLVQSLFQEHTKT